MQEILVKLLKYCVNGFFLRHGEPNYDPEGFKNWLFTVAQNVKNDFAKNIRRIQFIESTELDETTGGSYEEGLFCTSESIDRLENSFRIVMDSDSGVYKVLTWVALMLIIADQNVSRIDSTGILVQKCESMTLDSMLDLVIRQSDNIPWLQMDENQLENIRGRLDKLHASGRRLGDMAYGEFFMAKGAKASVCDWVNRLNDYIKKSGRKEEEK